MYAIGILRAPFLQVRFLKLLNFAIGGVEGRVQKFVLYGFQLEEAVLRECEAFFEVRQLFDIVKLLTDDLAQIVEQALLSWLGLNLERLKSRGLEVYLHEGRPQEFDAF